ncbi:hypothetical protein PUR61_21775 [Streptomyces sp. BE20]|uniref:hypothetical protein n=1 Tax=unclassified Streptomyces TaxID=2593676 RepID=UPI002E79C6A7|nr:MULTISPECIES: hypothetical protein [unclassified Streptomyces]MED7948485.1 hypothetical protein [Streptomyces sp. BE303]MEE1824788.1 hypothetical protein [Streptomyces sp. BE20]
MKNLLGFVSFVLVVGGISGLVSDHLWGLHVFGSLRYLIPAGYETVGYPVMIVLGAVLGGVVALLDRAGRND